MPDAPTRITVNMRACLELALQTGELRRLVRKEGEPAPDWPLDLHPSTLAALVRRDLLEKGRRRNRAGRWMATWRITDAGRLVLNPPPKQVEDRDWYLANPGPNRGDYTRDRHHSIDPDLAVVHLSDHWSRAAARRRDAERGTQDRPPGQKPPHRRAA